MTSTRRWAGVSCLMVLSIIIIGVALCAQASGAASPDQPNFAAAPDAAPYYPVTLPDGGTQDLELLVGQEAWEELKAGGGIVATSPLYDALQPIVDRITRAAKPQYAYPLRFYLVHGSQPNAFSVPGGNIYVVDALLFFVKNQEELAGTLCHEVSHTIHHDSMNKLEKEYKKVIGGVGVALLLGPTPARVLAIALLSRLGSLGYSREVEMSADLTGADICASAGLNPWGLVWLFQDFKNSRPNEVPELLSDHPNDEHRVRALKDHFNKNPAVFGKFNPNPASATVMKLPRDTAETFVR